MIRQHGDYEIDDSFDRIDFDRVHGWLASSYWSPGIAREKVERAAKYSSIVVGAYLNGEQAGYLRVVSDRATFAWIADVWVDEAHRGKGIARAMVRFALEHPEHQGFRRWVLATKDANGVYAGCGFVQIDNPERWMIYRPEGQLQWDRTESAS